MTRMARVRRQLGDASGFTLIELLVVVATVSLLLSLLLPALGRARAQARAVVCGSNVRQLALANMAYAEDHGGYLCPGALRLATENRHRWHGTRARVDEPFDGACGPLVTYLGPEAAIRACPELPRLREDGLAAFERGCGGYGYNHAYLGRVLRAKANGSFHIVADAHGPKLTQLRRPDETLMFADTAFAATAGVLIEYSFAEPRLHPEYLHWQARLDPSLHFRHAERVSVAWADGHVDRRSRTFTWRSGLYTCDPDGMHLGWFGVADDNSLFDLE